MANLEFGVRQFLNLVVILLAFYQRHKSNIDEHLNDTTRGAMNNLLVALPLLEAMRIIGPNPTTPDEGTGSL